MNQTKRRLFNLFHFLGLFAAVSAAGAPSDGLKNTVVMIIRHAEKPDDGPKLSKEGDARAQAYVDYFQQLSLDGKPMTPDYLMAGADSGASERPRLTLEPLSKALGLKIHGEFKTKQPEKAAAHLREHPRGSHILVCWRHGEIPDLLRSLGADPETLLPGDKWPDDVFCWMIVLRYDDQGQLMASKFERINEKLMSGDADKK